METFPSKKLQKIDMHRNTYTDSIKTTESMHMCMGAPACLREDGAHWFNEDTLFIVQ